MELEVIYTIAVSGVSKLKRQALTLVDSNLMLICTVRPEELSTPALFSKVSNVGSWRAPSEELAMMGAAGQRLPQEG